MCFKSKFSLPQLVVVVEVKPLLSPLKNHDSCRREGSIYAWVHQSPKPLGDLLLSCVWKVVLYFQQTFLFCYTLDLTSLQPWQRVAIEVCPWWSVRSARLQLWGISLPVLMDKMSESLLQICINSFHSTEGIRVKFYNCPKNVFFKGKCSWPQPQHCPVDVLLNLTLKSARDCTAKRRPKQLSGTPHFHLSSQSKIKPFEEVIDNSHSHVKWSPLQILHRRMWVDEMVLINPSCTD